MPLPIKTALSIIVLLVAYVYQDSIDQFGPKIAIMVLAPFMVVAMWIFPEVTRK